MKTSTFQGKAIWTYLTPLCSVVSNRYEKALPQAIKHVVTGDIVRMLLIQVRHHTFRPYHGVGESLFTHYPSGLVYQGNRSALPALLTVCW